MKKISGSIATATLSLFVVFGVLFLNAGNVFASATPTSATLNGSSGTITVAPNSSIAVALSVTTTGSGTSNDWNSTSWRISTTAPGSTTCINTPDNSGAANYVENFNITAPASAGTYNVYLIPFNSGNCSTGQGSTLTLAAKVIVSNQPDFTVTKTNNVSGSVNGGSAFNWILTITNLGTSASFTSGQTIVSDSLPTSNATYGTVTSVNAGGTTGTVSCSITSNNLSCAASGGSVTLPTNGTITVTIPVTTGLSAGSLVNPRGGGTCSVDPDLVVTELNESNNACSNSVTVVGDSTRPTATMSYSQTPIKAGDTLTIQADFNETMLDAPAPQISIYGANTVATSTMTKVTATRYTFAYVVGAGNGTARVALGTGTDASGNVVVSAPTNPTFTVDNTAPTLTVVTPVPVNTNDTTPNFTFNSSEAGILQYTGDCSAATGTANSGNNTVTFNTLAAGTHSNCTVKVTDGALNASALLAVPAFTIDTTAPTVTINQAGGQIDPTGSSPVTFTAVFSEPINAASFIASDLTLSPAGSTAIITPVDSVTYSISVSGMSVSGPVTATMAANRVTDLAGNQNTASTFTDNSVQYNLPQYEITVNQTTGGTIAPGTGTFDQGTNHTYTITPGTGYIVAEVYADGDSVGAVSSWSFNAITMVHDITAIFDGGWKQPSSFANSTGLTSQANAYSSNNAYVVFDSGADQIDYNTFALAIPAGATIDGIEVAVEGSREAVTGGETLRSFNVSLTSNGTAFTTAKTNIDLGTTENTVVLGTNTDKWGRAWTAADLNGGSFGVRVDPNTATNGRDFSVDQVQVKVSYTPDTTAPTGGSVSYTDGYFTSASVPVTYTLGTDAAAGINNASGKIQRASATLSGTTCDTFGSFTDLVTEFDGSYTDTTVANGNCYMYQYVINDNAGNTATYTSANVAKVDTVAPIVTVDPYTTAQTNSDINVTASTNEGTLNAISHLFTANDSFTFTATDAAGNSSSQTVTITNIDKTAPTISITGANPVTVAYGIGYSDEGATASDDHDGALVPVVSGDTVTATSPVGTYHIYYNVSDSAGNAATQADRTITVIAKDINVTATAQTKVYGEVDPTLTYTADALSGSDAFTGSLTRAPGEAVAAYAISQGTLSAGSNYTINFTGADLEITKKSVTVTADAGQSKEYGQSDAVLTYAFTPALVGSDAFSGELARAAGETVGDYSISQGSLSLSGDYTLVFNSSTFAITKKTASVTPDAKTKVFGESDPTLTGTLAGFLEADGVTASYSRVAGETVLGSPYTISATLDPLGVLGNYEITYNTAEFTITKAPQTITFGALGGKTFGDAAFNVSATASSGLDVTFSAAGTCEVSGTLVTITGAGSCTITAHQTGNSDYNAADDVEQSFSIAKANTTVTWANPADITYGTALSATQLDASASVAGTFVYTPAAGTVLNAGNAQNLHVEFTPTDTANYNPSSADVSINVLKAGLTITASTDTMVYGGTVPTITASYAGFENGDSAPDTAPSCSTTATQISTVGSYPSSCAGAADANYDISYVDGSVEVTKASISVIADDQTKTYGDANPVFTGSITGILNDDAITASYSSIADETSAIGEYDIVPLLSGAALSNYDAPVLTNGKLTVTGRAITVTADAKSKTYGEADPALTYQITSGALQNGDDFTGALTRTAGEDIGGYPITVGTLVLSGNYDLTFVPSALTIGVKTINVTAEAKTKVYGEADPALTYTSDELTSGDSFSGSLERVTGESVGDYAIQQGTLALTSNYNLVFNTANLSITRAGLMVTADPQTKVYGAADPALTYQVSGLQNGDTASVVTGALARATGEDVGSYTINQGTIVASGNYVLSFTGNNLVIGKKTATVTANDKSKVYGAANPALDATVTGTEGSDTLDYSLNTTATETSASGAYPISVTLGSNPNYEVTSTDGTLTVGTASLTITADDKTIAYGDAEPSFTFQYAGFVNGDSAADTLPTCTVSGAHTAFGTYPIVCSGAADSDYEITYAPGTLSVGATPLTITASSDVMTFGGTVPTITPSYSGLQNGDTTPATAPVCSTTATDVSPVGVYTTSCSGAVDANYSISYTDGTVSVSAASASIALGDLSQVYDASAKNASVTTVPAALANTVTYDGGAAPTDVGTYAAVATITDTNYTGTDSQSFVITKASVSVTADNKSINFGEADPVFTFVYGAFQGADTDAVIDTAPTCSVSGAHTAPGTYPITCADGSDNNYDFTYTAGTLTIVDAAAPVVTVPANISVPATDASGAVVSFTATATDDVDGSITPTCTPVSGSTFAIGTTTVICTATDAALNGASAQFYVGVFDSSAPVITVPANIVVEALDALGASVNYVATASDVVDGSVSVTCAPVSGTVFAITTTVVTCTAQDSALNAASATFNIIVEDTTAPVIALTGDATINLTIGDTYTEAGATAADAVDGDLAAVVGGDTVNTALVGTYIVSYTKTDAHGNAATEVSRTVNVADLPAPVISAETAATFTTTTATITWTTDHPATSRVVFDTVSHDPVTDVAPNYGYQFSTTEDSTLTTSHSVEVTGLTPNTQYYLRPVSHGSPESFGIEVSGSTESEEVPPEVGTLNIQKVVVGGTKSAGDFSFQLDGGIAQIFDVSGTNFVSVSVGTHSVNEVNPNTGNYLTTYGGDCSALGSVTVGANETKTCVITNTYSETPPVLEGNLKVIKKTVGSNGFNVFSFNGDAGNFSIFTFFGTGSKTIRHLAPGSYTVNENPKSGWTQTSSTCQNVTVAAGHTSTCTIVNTKNAPTTGSLKVIKKTIGGNGRFSFELSDGESNAGDFTIRTSRGKGSKTISRLEPGTYSVAEESKVGWTETSNSCEDVVVTAGRTTSCTIVNTKIEIDDGDDDNTPETGTIVVNKVTVPEGDTADFNFTASYDADGFVLSDGESNVAETLAPGSYSLAEEAQVGWESSASCTSTVPEKAQVAQNIDLAAGETVTCTFTNTKVAPTTGSIVVKKETTPDLDTTDFSFTASYSEGGFVLADGESNVATGLTAGSYSVAEGALPSGWTQTSAVCDDGSAPSSIQLSEGETVTCTFTNTKTQSGSGSNNGGSSSGSNTGGGSGGGGNGPISGSLGGGGSVGGQVLGASTTNLPELPAGCSALLNSHMRFGKKNESGEVKKLQQFLNDRLSANLPVTGFFGQMTNDAVKKFQISHSDQILKPWGITNPTGYVYKTTQRWINLTSCSSLNIPMPELN